MLKWPALLITDHRGRICVANTGSTHNSAFSDGEAAHPGVAHIFWETHKQPKGMTAAPHLMQKHHSEIKIIF